MRLSQITSIIVENVDFSGIPDEYARRLQEFKPHYQEWGAKALREGKHIQSVIDCIKHYIKNIGDNRFQELLKNITPHPKNILTFTYDQLKKAQNDYDVKYHSLSNREAERLRKKQDLAGFKTDYTEVLANGPDLKIIKFHKGDNIEEAVKIVTQMSKGTKWCTNGPDMAKEYLEQGPLYLIIIDGVKLLCHIETDQLMDVNNDGFEINEDQYYRLSNYIPKVGVFLGDHSSPIYREAIAQIPSKAYYYARDVIKGRWPEAEPYIMTGAYAYIYAKYIIKGIWPEAEPHIMRNPAYAYHYAEDVIKGRWPEAEPYIMTDHYSAYSYARDVIKGRWLEAEPYIMKNAETACSYARDVIKGRWPEAEPYIMKNAEYWRAYLKTFGDNQPL